MKSISSSIVAAAILVSCHSCFTSDEDRSHLSRTEAFGDKYKNLHRGGDSGIRDKLPSDTVVLVTGVEFDDGYDWRRDTSYGSACGRIILLRNGEKVMDIEAGGNAHASTAPDKHHLVEGHVFTEFCDASGTYIGKDGQELFSYPVRESLRGLVIEGEDVFTLGQGLDGQGLALRRNGESVFSCREGNVTGQMLDSPDYPTGALYMDGGHMYFSYWRPETDGSGRKAWFIVEDGRETQIDADPHGMFDIRVSEGQVKVGPLSAQKSIFTRFSDDCMVIAYQDGTMMIRSPDMDNAVFTDEKYYYFSFRNSCLCGTALFVALTPYEKGKAPFIWKNGAVYETGINGFFTGISVSVVPGKDS